jgi:hypothetical protein
MGIGASYGEGSSHLYGVWQIVLLEGVAEVEVAVCRDVLDVTRAADYVAVATYNLATMYIPGN